MPTYCGGEYNCSLCGQNVFKTKEYIHIAKDKNYMSKRVGYYIIGLNTFCGDCFSETMQRIIDDLYKQSGKKDIFKEGK